VGISRSSSGERPEDYDKKDTLAVRFNYKMTDIQAAMGRVQLGSSAGSCEAGSACRSVHGPPRLITVHLPLHAQEESTTAMSFPCRRTRRPDPEALRPGRGGGAPCIGPSPLLERRISRCDGHGTEPLLPLHRPCTTTSRGVLAFQEPWRRSVYERRLASSPRWYTLSRPAVGTHVLDRSMSCSSVQRSLAPHPRFSFSLSTLATPFCRKLALRWG